MLTLEDRRQAEFDKYRRIYRDYPNYTNKPIRIDLTREWMQSHEGALSLLDVGAGRGEVVNLAQDEGLLAFGLEVIVDLCDYIDVGMMDGAHKLPDDWTSQFDLVTCTDVLEHILEEDVPAALSELARVARGPILMVICHRPDTPGKFGPDTLHITVHPREWWEAMIREHMGAEPKLLYADRVNENGSWIEVNVS